MAKKIIKWVIIVALLAAASTAAWMYFKPKEEINYITENVRRSNIRQTVTATGEISAAQLVDVGSQASGQIKKLHVKLGQQVSKGDLIAEIDSTTQMNTLNTEKAKLDTFQAQLASAEIKLKSMDKKLKREQALWKEDATSKAELEDAQDNYAAAKASVAELKSQIRQSQIAINTFEADLGYTRITAPISGTVVAVMVEEGQTVNANQTTPNIAQIADLGKMLNKMQIAEGDANKVKAGLKLTFTTLSQPDNIREAVLDVVDPGLTTMSKGSYTTSTDTSENAVYYYARSIVPNADGSLHIGMTTENTIIINDAANVLTVPNLSIQSRNGKKFVRLMPSEKDKNGQPQEREVQTGLTDGTNTEIKSGVKEGDKVIVSESNGSDTKSSNRHRPGGPGRM